MSIIRLFHGGEVGTPEIQKYLNAITLMTNVLCLAGNGLKCVAVPEEKKFLKSEMHRAPEGTMVKTCRFEIRDTNDVVQTWYNGTGTITPTEDITDDQGAIPVVSGGNTVQFVDGVAEVTFTMVTDAGATIDPDTDDSVTLTMAVPNVAGIVVNVDHAAHKAQAEQTPLLWAYQNGVKDKTISPSAAQANVAGAGSMREYLEFRLVDSEGTLQTWFDGHIHITATENCADAQIGVPKVYTLAGVEVAAGGELAMVDGRACCYIVYDTDADATKHYIANDFVPITPSMDTIEGEAVTVTDAIVIATFVA